MSQQNDVETSSRIDPEAVAWLILETRKLLAFHDELGLSHYPEKSGLSRLFIRKHPVQAAQELSDNKSGRNTVTSGASRESVSDQLKIIEKNIAECARCATAAMAKVQGRGSSDARLFVVGDWCHAETPGEDLLWAAEVDELFWKMMAAIGLDAKSVYVTNCVKCRDTNVDSLAVDRHRACFSHLEQELLAMQPEIICIFGEVAAGLLLKKKAPINRLRGRFHQYRYPHGGKAKVMVTYHPRFLLQHPEMKQAAWADLQAVQRNLPR